jgi:hypothetical protein
MVKIKIKKGRQIDVESARKLAVNDCKQAATAHIDSFLPDYKQRNIAILGEYSGVTKERAGSFILSVKNRCDEYENEIKNSKSPELIKIDYSDINL